MATTDALEVEGQVDVVAEVEVDEELPAVALEEELEELVLVLDPSTGELTGECNGISNCTLHDTGRS